MCDCLEMKERVWTYRVWSAMHAGSDQIGQLVCVLADAGHTNCSRPIVVQVSQLVRQPLEAFRIQDGAVFDHVVRGRVDSALAYALRDQKEVEPLRQRHDVVHHGSGRRVDGRASVVDLEEPGVDPLGDDDEGELRVHVVLLEQALDGGNLHLLDLRNLSVAHSVPIDDDSPRKAAVVRAVLVQGVGQTHLHLAQQLLVVSMHGAGGGEPSKSRVQCGHDGPHGQAPLVGIVVRVVSHNHGVFHRHLHRPRLCSAGKLLSIKYCFFTGLINTIFCGQLAAFLAFFCSCHSQKM